MSWVLIRWKPRDGDARMPRFRNMYDIMTSKQWGTTSSRVRDQWHEVAVTATEAEAKALLNLMPRYNDDIQTS